MGRKRGVEGPPEEAYSRVTNPERFVRSMASRSVSWDGLKPRSMRNVKRRAISTTSSAGRPLNRRCGSPLALPTVARSPSSSRRSRGLLVRLGHWVVEPGPGCGCDACDETAEQEQARLESMVADLTTGRSPSPFGSGCGGMCG
jgi:uncharacterized protein DUF6226